MAKKIKHVVLRSGTYGKKGDVILVALPQGGLTDRQQLMLRKYEAPVVEGDEDPQVQVKELTEANEKLTAEVKELTAKLTEATKPKK